MVRTEEGSVLYLYTKFEAFESYEVVPKYENWVT